MKVLVEGQEYVLEFDKRDPFVSPVHNVAFCDLLAIRYKPVILDPAGYGQHPTPPEFMAYRMVHDNDNKRLCILYEVYWTRQDCWWRELNKDHVHDYEQIQIHFGLKQGNLERVVLASAGPSTYGGHGVEIYRNTQKVRSGTIRSKTSGFEAFPWGSHNYEIWALEQPLTNLLFWNKKPVVRITNCFHVFTGIKPSRVQVHQSKSKHDAIFRNELQIPLCRLERRLLWKWYYQHRENKFAHDLSDPFKPPHILYRPSPSDFRFLFLYTFLGIIAAFIRVLTSR